MDAEEGSHLLLLPVHAGWQLQGPSLPAADTHIATSAWQIGLQHYEKGFKQQPFIEHCKRQRASLQIALDWFAECKGEVLQEQCSSSMPSLDCNALLAKHRYKDASRYIYQTLWWQCFWSVREGNSLQQKTHCTSCQALLMNA